MSLINYKTPAYKTRVTALHLMNSEDHANNIQASHVSILPVFPLGSNAILIVQRWSFRQEAWNQRCFLTRPSSPRAFPLLFLLPLPRRRGQGVRTLILPPEKVCSPLYPSDFSPPIFFKPHTMMISFTQDPAASKGEGLLLLCPQGFHLTHYKASQDSRLLPIN